MKLLEGKHYTLMNGQGNVFRGVYRYSELIKAYGFSGKRDGPFRIGFLPLHSAKPAGWNLQPKLTLVK